MARIYRTLQAAGALCALAVLTALSTVGSATALSTQQTTTGAAFCKTLAAKADAAEDRFDGLRTKVTKVWSQQDTVAKQLVNDTDKKVAEARQDVDDQRRLNFAKLEDKATTETQKGAVKAYETAITTAATTRRAVVDTARQTFRSAVAAMVNSRRDALSDQASGLRSAVAVAYTTAQTSCDGGVAPATVRSTLLDSLKTSRETFADQRQSDTKVRGQIGALAKTRDAVIKTADETFVSAAKTAGQTLEQTLGDKAGQI